MLDFIVAPFGVCYASAEHPVRVSIPDEESYAFFAPCFARARLDETNQNFLGFWGRTEISGDQLVRLREMLEECLLDLSARPPRFQVLRQGDVGRDILRDDLKEIAQDLVFAIHDAQRTANTLIAIGD
jgi:hypothetical protein